jgi:hypothetical protein
MLLYQLELLGGADEQEKEKVAGTHINLPPSTGNHVLFF